jgi:hypothetical protein
MSHDGADRLGLERGLARIGQEIHCRRISGFRIDIGKHARLQNERTSPGHDVFQVHRRARTAVDRNRRLSAIQAIFRAGVAASGIANDFDLEVDGVRRTVSILRGPRERNAEQTAVQQERVRAPLILRETRAVRTVERRKDRVLAVRAHPALDHAGCGNAHRIRRLMAVHTSAAVRPQRHKEGMAFGIHRPRGVNHPKRSVRIFERVGSRQNYVAARLHPSELEIVLGLKCKCDASETGGEQQFVHSDKHFQLYGVSCTRSAEPQGSINTLYWNDTMAPASGEITLILQGWDKDRESAVQALTPIVYAELRKIAAPIFAVSAPITPCSLQH